MKVLAKKAYPSGECEIWFGIPTWDPLDRNQERSVKYAYRTKDKGRWARTSPEVPEAVVWDMLVVLNEHGRLGKALELAGPDRNQLRRDVDGVIAALQELRRRFLER